MPSGNGSLLLWEGFEDDDSSSLYHNSFAEHTETTFTSALRPNGTRVVTRPALRRRVSDGAQKRVRNDHDPWQDERIGTSHLRSSTADPSVASISRAKHHPLARHPRGSKSNNSIVSLNDTRPHLKRLLSDMGAVASSTLKDNSKDSDPEHSPVGDTSGQRMVIVHEVSPTDSLAGVALKYGVSLADLRRANQMWASDTIHLRKLLYIPLEKTQKSKHFNLASLIVDTEPPAPVLESEGPSGAYVSRRSDLAGNGAKDSSLTIRRVPASQLSYFPPPSRLVHVNSSPSSHTMPRSYNDQSMRPPFDLFSSMLSTPPPNQPGDHVGSHIPTPPAAAPLRYQITSLFNALPIVPSTRDTLLARLSLDSSASTPTQGSEEQEHEMKDVGGSSFPSFPSENAGRRLALSNQYSQRADIAVASTSDPALELRLMSPSRTPVRRRSHGSSSQLTATQHTSSQRAPTPAPYSTPDRVVEQPGVLRTAQLQPSPGMQLPPKARRSKDGYA